MIESEEIKTIKAEIQRLSKLLERLQKADGVTAGEGLGKIRDCKDCPKTKGINKYYGYTLYLHRL